MSVAPEQLSTSVGVMRSGAVTVTRCAGSPWPDVMPRWKELASASPYVTFFLTTEWVETWLSVYGARLNTEILLFSHQDETVGCCILVYRQDRRGPLRWRRVYLNTAGEDEHEEAALEFNDLLCKSGWEVPVAETLRDYLVSKSWDELILQGCCRSAAIGALRETFSGLSQRCDTVPSFYVDFESVRLTGNSYETVLSSKVRKHMRQSIRLYEQKLGALKVESPRDIDEAMALLNQLETLHQQRWSARNEPGAFASVRFREFHSRLIRLLFASGGVRLNRVTAGEQVIGVTYSFVRDGKVYFYQCGYSYDELQKNLRPGVVTLFLVIQEFLAQGFAEYDMMAGNAEYKRWLSSGHRELDWVVVERASFNIRALRVLRHLKGAGARMVPRLLGRSEG